MGQAGSLKPSIDSYSKSTNPTWVTFDRKVLRFYGYFLEETEQSNRIRKVNVYFYLEDDSIHVSEPKTTNSGSFQGTLIRRHQINKTGTDHFIVSDLNVGKAIILYAKKIQLVSCDNFTRDFLTSIDISVPPNDPDVIGQDHGIELHF